MTDSVTCSDSKPGKKAGKKGKGLKTSDSSPELTSDQVTEYLKHHPDFFVERDDLLASLTLPHRRGNTISLVERQISVLRERNEALNDRLGKMVDVAHDNDRLFQRSQRLVLALIESNDLEQVAETLRDGLENDFGIEFHSLILFNKKTLDIPVRTENPDVANSVLGDLLVNINGGQKVVCSRLPEKELKFLFPDKHQDIGSVALSPLNFPDSVGVLALGSRDEVRFKASMGKLFLGHLGDVLCRVLSRFI